MSYDHVWQKFTRDELNEKENNAVTIDRTCSSSLDAVREEEKTQPDSIRSSIVHSFSL